MYRFNQTIRKWGIAALTLTLAFTTISWNDSLIHSNGILADIYAADTIPGSLDDHIKKLERARLELDDKLAEKDWGRVEKDIEQEIQRAISALQESKKLMQLELKNLDADMLKVKEHLMEAGKELTSYRKMIHEMDKEGLISDKRNYRIEYRNEQLIINGKEQPKVIADRYRNYFRKSGIVISNENNRFNMEKDQ